jgi:predicted dehydrogenase
VLGGYVPDYPAIGGGPDMVFQIVGDGGYLLGRRPDRLSAVTRDGIRDFTIQPVDAFGAELVAFLDALTHGRPVPVPGEAGLLAQAIIATARASSDSGQREPIASVSVSLQP